MNGPVRKNWPRRISPATTRTLPPARLGGRGHSRFVATNKRAVTLRWTKPRERRCATAYRCKSRARSLREGWTTLVATRRHGGCLLEDQETGVELEYRRLCRSTRPATGPATDMVRLVL